jgi:hypothetical protein
MKKQLLVLPTLMLLLEMVTVPVVKGADAPTLVSAEAVFETTTNDKAGTTRRPTTLHWISDRDGRVMLSRVGQKPNCHFRPTEMTSGNSTMFCD